MPCNQSLPYVVYKLRLVINRYLSKYRVYHKELTNVTTFVMHIKFLSFFFNIYILYNRYLHNYANIFNLIFDISYKVF